MNNNLVKLVCIDDTLGTVKGRVYEGTVIAARGHFGHETELAFAYFDPDGGWRTAPLFHFAPAE